MNLDLDQEAGEAGLTDILSDARQQHSQYCENLQSNSENNSVFSNLSSRTPTAAYFGCNLTHLTPDFTL